MSAGLFFMLALIVLAIVAPRVVRVIILGLLGSAAVIFAYAFGVFS